MKNNIIRNHIVIEGIDGCGKSTFIRMLSEDKENEKKYKEIGFNNICYDSSPFDKEATILIRSLLKKDNERKLDTSTKNSILLDSFMIDNNIHAAHIEKYCNDKENNNLLFTDRYIASTFAYQSLGNSYDTIKRKFNESNIKYPGLFIYFDINQDISLERINKRGEEKEIFEEKEILKNVIFNYYKFFRNALKDTDKQIKIAIIDASKDIETVYNNTKNMIFDYLTNPNDMKDCDTYKLIQM